MNNIKQASKVFIFLIAGLISLTAQAQGEINYDHLKGKVIVYGFALDGATGLPSVSLPSTHTGMSPAYGYVSARVGNDGKVVLIADGYFMFKTPQNYVPNYPVTIVNFQDSDGSNVVQEHYKSKNSDTSNTVSLGEHFSASISPSGLTVNVKSKEIGAYHNAIIPWSTSLKFAKAMIKDRSQPYAILQHMNSRNNPSSSDYSQTGYVYQPNINKLN